MGIFKSHDRYYARFKKTNLVSEKICYSINTYDQFQKLVGLKKNKRKILIIFIKNYLITGLGIDWLNALIKLAKKNYSKYNIKFYVDAGNDHGLSILIIRENIHYLKLRSNKIILNKINDIAKKNKVLLNPNFDVVDLAKIRNYKNLEI